MTSVKKRKPHTARESTAWYGGDSVMSPFKRDVWIRLSPAERLDRAWRLRDRIPNPEAVHDRKLFPKP
jgi:hypothetical protein